MKRTFRRAAFATAFAAISAASVGPLSGQQPDNPDRGLAIVVDLSQRQLEVRIDGKLYSTHEVAIGQPDHRTPTGTYSLSKVIWNPSWVPPASEWAAGKERMGPADPDNPMGDVKIYFRDLYYIHGTDATHTLGEPASHGCIRMRNEAAMNLARLVMEYGGAAKADSWYEQVKANESETVEVSIPDPPVLRISG